MSKTMLFRFVLVYLTTLFLLTHFKNDGEHPEGQGWAVQLRAQMEATPSGILAEILRRSLDHTV